MKLKRVLKITAGVMGALLLTALLVIYAGSEIILRRTYEVPLADIPVPKDSASLKEGERLAQLYHCAGCHGAGMAGKRFFEIDHVGTLVAPNLTTLLPTYTDADLARLIRHGVRPNGTATWMPVCAQYYHISDSHLGMLMAYLRTIPEMPSAEAASTSFQILGRVGMISDQFVAPAAVLDHNAARLPDHDTGRYFATTVCSGCHGDTFQGRPGHAPSLVLAKMYNAEQFTKLMKTGEGLTKKDLGQMSAVAREHLRYFTDAEIAAIYEFLQKMP